MTRRLMARIRRYSMLRNCKRGRRYLSTRRQAELDQWRCNSQRRTTHINLIRELGCDETIDYKTTRFEDSVHDVDVVLDPQGADSHRRSFAVLKKGGILVALLEEPRQDLAWESGVRATMIGVKPAGKVRRGNGVSRRTGIFGHVSPLYSAST
jgi:zinc-binding alcohol dehydrogenase family protein